MIITLMACRESEGPAVVCVGAPENAIMPGQVELDVSGSTPFDKFELKGFQMTVIDPTGEKSLVFSEDGKFNFDFTLEGTYQVTIVGVDTSEVASKTPYKLEVVVMNPFKGIAFNSNLKPKYPTDKSIEFSLDMISGIEDKEALIAGIEWSVREVAVGGNENSLNTNESGTGKNWTMRGKIKNIVTEPGLETSPDYFVDATLFDQYGNSYTITQSFYISDPDKPIINLDLYRHENGLSTSARAQVTGLGAVSQLPIYEKERIYINYSRSLPVDPESEMGGITMDSISVQLFKLTGVDADDQASWSTVSEILTLREASIATNPEVWFDLATAGKYKIVTTARNSAHTQTSPKESQENTEIIVSENAIFLSNAVLPNKVYEGDTVLIQVDAKSASLLYGDIVKFYIDFETVSGTQKTTIIEKEDFTYTEGKVTFPFVTEVAKDVKADLTYSLAIRGVNEIPNESEALNIDLVVLDNSPRAIINVHANTVFFDTPLSFDFSGSGSEQEKYKESDNYDLSVRIKESGTELDPSRLTQVDGVYSFIPQEADGTKVNHKIVYTIELKVSNSLSGISDIATAEVAGSDAMLLPSFLVERKEGNPDFYEGWMVILDATASRDVDKNMIADGSYLWSLEIDGVPVADEDISNYITKNSERGVGFFNLSLKNTGNWKVALKVKAGDEISTEIASRYITVLDNTPYNVTIIEDSVEIIEGEGSPVTKRAKYNFSVNAESPDGIASDFQYYWFVNKSIDYDLLPAAAPTFTGEFASNAKIVISVLAVKGTEEVVVTDKNSAVGRLVFNAANLEAPRIIEKPIMLDYYTNTGTTTVSWNPSSASVVDEVTEYRVQYNSESENGWQTIKVLDDFTGEVETRADIVNAEGDYTLFVQEKKKGFWSMSGVATIIRDETKPSAPEYVNFPSNALTNDPVISFWEWTEASDDHGILGYEYSVVDSADDSISLLDKVYVEKPSLRKPDDFAEFIAAEEEKNLILRVRSKDYAGNFSGYSNKELKIDRVRPAAPRVAGDGVPYYNKADLDASKAFSWSWEAVTTEDHGKYSLELLVAGALVDGYPVETMDSTFVYDMLTAADGIYELRVFAIDQAGNKSTVPLIMTTIRDVVIPAPPELVTMVPSGAKLKNLSATGTSRSDLVDNRAPTLEYSADLTLIKAYRSKVSGVSDWEETKIEDVQNIIYPAFTADEAQNWEVQVQDFAGNWSHSTAIKIIVDTQAPKITFPDIVTRVFPADGKDVNNIADYIHIESSVVYTDNGLAGVDTASKKIELVATSINGTENKIYENGIKYTIADNIGNTIEVFRDFEVMTKPIMFVWDNAGFEKNTTGNDIGGGAMPGTAATAGWFMEDFYYGTNGTQWSQGWSYYNRGPVTGFTTYKLNTPKDDTQHFLVGGVNDSKKSGNFSFKLRQYQIVYEGAIGKEGRVTGGHGKLVYGYGKVGSINVNRDCWLFKDVTYKIKFWAKLNLGMNGDTQEYQARFEERNAIKNGTVQGSSTKWNVTKNENWVLREWEFTPTKDFNGRFVLEFIGPGKQSNFHGAGFWVDDFSIEVMPNSIK